MSSICLLMMAVTFSKAIVLASPNEQKKLIVAFPEQPRSALIYVASEKKYFANLGLAVRLSPQAYGKIALSKVAKGDADIANVAETAVLFSILRGEKIYVIASIDSSNLNNAIVARKDSGINKAQDLKGKIIAHTPGTSSEFFMDSILIANGINRKDVTAKGLEPDEMLSAIAEKKVDAVSTWNFPVLQIKNKLGKNAIVFIDKDIFTSISNVVVRQEVYDNNREALIQFLKALQLAEKFIEQNPTEAQNIVAKVLQIDPSLVKDAWNLMNYKLVLDQALLISLEDGARWAIKNKLTDKTSMPRFSDFLKTDCLKSISPDRVRMDR